jgi:hypothetical protein
MPSVSLQHWQNDRRLRLTEMDAHCAASAALAPPNALLAEESLCGFVMLLSGHFQGFCRDLYAECSQIVAAQVPVGMRGTIQAQFVAALKLNYKNPTVDTIKKDFERFAFTLDFSADPANGPRVTHLGHLNRWRNCVAHQSPGVPQGVPLLTLQAVRDWRVSCDGLAGWLDAIMHVELSHILGAPP